LFSYDLNPKNKLTEELDLLIKKYNEYKSKGLDLDMSRGKLSKEQLEISSPMLDILPGDSNFIVDKSDCRNYGLHDGISTMKSIFSRILNVNSDNIFIGGNSSISMMFDIISLYFTHGVCKEKPWSQQPKVKFLCPVPGYDRHFNILSYFNIEPILVPMKSDGPDMDIVEEAVRNDESIKGICCVPKYSNPQGIIYSDEVVKRFSKLHPRSADFRIFWDNAYAVHDLTDSKEELLDLMNQCIQNKNEDLPIFFSSTSKITFPSSGVSALAASEKNLRQIKNYYNHKTIGFDKLNQLRHAKFLINYENLLEHMKKHRKLLRPKFQVILNCFAREFSDSNKNLATWNEPKGGYFISVDVEQGLAKTVVELCKDAGVKLTDAGATFPGGIDLEDKNIRIAPSYLPANELNIAVNLFCICVKIAAVRKRLLEN
jgi:DNA-binding transcriptional MocR family regulator